MRPRLSTLAALAIATSALPALAQEEGSIGAGTRVGNGSKVTTRLHNNVRLEEDVDDFVFDGFAGQALSVVVAGKSDPIPGKPAFIPFVDLHRPDGSLVGPADGAKLRPPPVPSLRPSKKPKIAFKLDQTGVWTLRVRGAHVSKPFHLVDDPGTPDVNEGDDPATIAVETEYDTVGFDYGQVRTTGNYTLLLKLGPTPPTKAKNLVPVNGEYRFLVPGIGGGTFNAALRWSGGGAPVFFAFQAPDGSQVPGIGGSLATTPTSSAVKNYAFPPTMPLGSYVLTYQASAASPATKVKFLAKLKVPKGPKPLQGKLSTDEPIVTQVIPAEGGPGSLVTVTVTRMEDPYDEVTEPRALIGRFPLVGVVNPADPPLVTATTITGRAPSNLPEGTFDVVVESSSGQAAVRAKSFKRVPPPDALTIDPVVGTSAGGFDVTVTGTNFNPAQNGMRIGFVNLADNSEFSPPVFIDHAQQTDRQLVFTMPTGALAVTPGNYRIKVIDTRTDQDDTVLQALELSDTAAIARVIPGLTPILGGETMYVQGARFDAGAVVHLEDAVGSNTFTAMATTFIDDRKLSFVAPARPKGSYRVKVDSLGFFTPTRSFACYSFADLTPTLGIDGLSDPWDASSTAIADFDRDGDEDLLLSRALTGVGAKQSVSQTRVLRNDGTGALSDVTSGTGGVMPAPSSDDDWRADRIWATDVNADSYPDVVITTNSKTVPAEAKSHTRILINEAVSASGTERVFRDRTSDLMPTPRKMTVLYGAATVTPDNWRGLDMWIGDLDLSASGPPEIVIVHDEPKEDLEVGCAPYCASNTTNYYTYSFYWGGAREFVWDKAARGGLGRYKYAHNFFPRKGGVTVQIFNPPPGVTIPTCTGGSCRGKFTPFAGQKIAVGSLDGDGKPDIAVVSNTTTLPGNVDLPSPLQIAVNKFSPAGGGSDVTDLTGKISSSETADAVAIGQPGFPDGNSYGVIAVAHAAASGGGSALRLYRFKPSLVPEDIGDFEEITTRALPSPLPANDAFQSSAIRFLDIDADGDQDLVLVAAAAPGGTEPAFRILRNEAGLVNGVPSVGVFRETLKPLVVTVSGAAGDPFDGRFLSIGDLDGDDALDFVVSRTAGPGLATRALRIDK